MTGRPPGSRNRPLDRKAASQAKKAYARALVAIQAAQKAKLDAVANMQAAGMTLRDIGEVLGVSHVAVLGILRAGTNGQASEAAGEAATVRAEPDPTAVAVVLCIRAGCDTPAGRGGRLCAAHLHS